VEAARDIVEQAGGNPNDPDQVIPVATDQNVILGVQRLRKSLRESLFFGEIVAEGTPADRGGCLRSRHTARQDSNSVSVRAEQPRLPPADNYLGPTAGSRSRPRFRAESDWQAIPLKGVTTTPHRLALCESVPIALLRDRAGYAAGGIGSWVSGRSCALDSQGMVYVTKAGVADFTWHCLRHTFASRLVMAGVDLRRVQELMSVLVSVPSPESRPQPSSLLTASWRC
jgi:hypothetical protein